MLNAIRVIGIVFGGLAILVLALAIILLAVMVLFHGWLPFVHS